MRIRKSNFWKVLENRFGQADADSTSKFGKNYFNGILGWQYSEDDILGANENGRLLTMDLDFPGNKCKLDCVYCFAKVGEKTGTYYRPGEGSNPLTIDEIKDFLIGAKKLGLKSIKVIGFREPFENTEFYDFIDFTTKLGVNMVVFTSAYTLGEEKFNGKLEKAIDFLANHKVSLMIKFHTLNNAKEDKIARCPGYAKERDRILKALLADGRFTNCSPTRLGLENVISSKNIRELLAIYEYFKIYRNVFVDLDPPIPIGRTGTLEEAEKAGLLSQNKLKELCTKVYAINSKFEIPFKGVSPYFGGNPCTQLTNGLYLTVSGKVMTCCGGDEEIGNIRTQSVKEIFQNNPHKNKNGVFHNCPYREKRGIMGKEFIKEVNYAVDQLLKQKPKSSTS